MRPWIWILAVATVGALAPAAHARADARDELLAYVLRSAEQDFDAVRDEAALSGSAPMVGLKADKKPAKKQKQTKGSRARADAKRMTEVAPKPAVVGRP